MVDVGWPSVVGCWSLGVLVGCWLLVLERLWLVLGDPSLARSRALLIVCLLPTDQQGNVRMHCDPIILLVSHWMDQWDRSSNVCSPVDDWMLLVGWWWSVVIG